MSDITHTARWRHWHSAYKVGDIILVVGQSEEFDCVPGMYEVIEITPRGAKMRLLMAAPQEPRDASGDWLQA